MENSCTGVNGVLFRADRKGHGRPILFGRNWLNWPCPVRSALKRTPFKDSNSFSIMTYYIINYVVPHIKTFETYFALFISLNFHTVHSDAFFRSQRDINRHGSWLGFWKIQVNLVNFISGTFGTAWDKYSKHGITFGCLREKKSWNFDLEIIFFKQKQDFGIFM